MADLTGVPLTPALVVKMENALTYLVRTRAVDPIQPAKIPQPKAVETTPSGYAALASRTSVDSGVVLAAFKQLFQDRQQMRERRAPIAEFFSAYPSLKKPEFLLEELSLIARQCGDDIVTGVKALLARLPTGLPALDLRAALGALGKVMNARWKDPQEEIMRLGLAPLENGKKGMAHPILWVTATQHTITLEGYTIPLPNVDEGNSLVSLIAAYYAFDVALPERMNGPLIVIFDLLRLPKPGQVPTKLVATFNKFKE